MKNDPTPKIDLACCTGCHRCVDICPTQALDQVVGKAFLCDSERCTYCLCCEEICPVNAIALPFLIILAPPVGTQSRAPSVATGAALAHLVSCR